MNMKPFVSVIIPNYNHAKYLDQRIQSVLNQSFQDFEVIILDDCSPDNGASRKVIEKYRDNPHVTHIIYNDRNSGSTFKQWDKGLNLANADIIWIAESDDYCELTFLEELIALWKRHPECSIIQSASVHVDQDGKICHPEKQYHGKEEYFTGLDYIKRFFVFSNYHIPNASGVTFRKSFAMEVPKDYENMKASGDRLFWIYMLEKGPICQINKPLSYFRQHLNKVSNKNELNGIQCRENYNINQYLHKRHYLNWMNKAREYTYYYQYIENTNFDTLETKQSLRTLWFSLCNPRVTYLYYNVILHLRDFCYRHFHI